MSRLKAGVLYLRTGGFGAWASFLGQTVWYVILASGIAFALIGFLSIVTRSSQLALAGEWWLITLLVGISIVASLAVAGTYSLEARRR